MSISTIIGNMGSGKSALLISEYKKVMSDNNPIAFKPSIDLRSINRISSRNGQSIPAIEITSFKDILSYIKDKNNIKYIFIDELQFIDQNGMKDLFIYIHKNNIELYASGLDLSSELNPFEVSSKFMCYSNNIMKLTSPCECDETNDSFLTDCVVEKKNDILIGGDESYIRACPNCHSLLR